MVTKVALICLKDKKLLIVHKKTIDMYISPGGKIKNKESDYDCLKREINEELNCNIQNIKYWDAFKDKIYETNEPLELICYFGDLYEKIKLNPNDNIDDYLWINRNYDRSLRLANLLKHKIIPNLMDKELM
ncbi:MAG: NUDIX domain-containing protein [Nanoarchaeota archaeon]